MLNPFFPAFNKYNKMRFSESIKICPEWAVIGLGIGPGITEMGESGPKILYRWVFPSAPNQFWDISANCRQSGMELTTMIRIQLLSKML